MVAVPPVRQNEDISNPSGTFTQGFRVPSLSFPYHPATFWERGNKMLLSPHLMFHGEKRGKGDFLEMECCHGNNLSPGID